MSRKFNQMDGQARPDVEKVKVSNLDLLFRFRHLLPFPVVTIQISEPKRALASL